MLCISFASDLIASKRMLIPWRAILKSDVNRTIAAAFLTDVCRMERTTTSRSKWKIFTSSPQHRHRARRIHMPVMAHKPLELLLALQVPRPPQAFW